jgi:hypothetical protein
LGARHNVARIGASGTLLEKTAAADRSTAKTVRKRWR